MQSTIHYTLYLQLNYIKADDVRLHFAEIYPNYSINIADTKEIASHFLDGKLPKQSLFLCDSDSSIDDICSAYPGHPVIAWMHDHNPSQSLMGTSFLITNLEVLSPEYLDEVYHHYHHLPLTIIRESSFYIRELCVEDFEDLLLLQLENEGNPEGCFFPSGEANPKEFLQAYIQHQYPFFCYGLYAIIATEIDSPENEALTGIDSLENEVLAETASPENEVFAGIAGYSTTSDYDDYLPVSYALIKKYQGKGLARKAVKALGQYAKEELYYKGCYAMIKEDNLPSIRLIKACGFEEVKKNKKNGCLCFM